MAPAPESPRRGEDSKNRVWGERGCPDATKMQRQTERRRGREGAEGQRGDEIRGQTEKANVWCASVSACVHVRVCLCECVWVIFCSEQASGQ